jgi:hypothetical protein|tara:strand:+ start:1249 stop:1593 length:345 start_codon:yes stop_codon:yes gene_type:complete
LWVFTKTTHKAAAENKQKATQQTVEITTETEGSAQRQPSTPCAEVENGDLPHNGEFFIPRQRHLKSQCLSEKQPVFPNSPGPTTTVVNFFFKFFKEQQPKRDEQNHPIALRAPL